MPEKLSLHPEPASPILVVGSIAFDNIITPTRREERLLGGSASYASLAASYYAPVRLVGVVGSDFEEAFKERFQKRGICLEGLRQDHSGPTFFWMGRYHEDFNSRDTLETHLNVFETFRPDLPESYRHTPFILLGNIGPDLQNHVLDQLEGEHFVLADTMDLWINTKHDELLALLKRIDCLVLNDSEAILLSGQANLIRAGYQLLEFGHSMVVIKKGEHGAILFHADGLFALPSYPVTQIQDPTGAGDAFAGGLLGVLAAIKDTRFATIKQAMLYATATASLAIEAFSFDGLESSGSSAIEERYEKLLHMISP